MTEHDKTVADLCDAVAAGTPFDAVKKGGGKGEIAAEVIRRLVLSLPLDDEEGPRPVTPAGIKICRAKIVGRVELEKVILQSGSPVPPIEFHDCILDGGFSGAHGHFSGLSFRSSRFVDWKDRLAPSVDLTDAAIHGELDMSETGPEATGSADDGSRHDQNHFWVRATGARIDGNVRLSFSTLRAPEDQSGRRMSEPAIDALSLSIAEVSGDILLVHASSKGRISGRGMRVTGDVWLSGARISNPGGLALFLQGARIGGMLMLDGRHERMDSTGIFRPFASQGWLNLNGIEVGGSVILANVEIEPGKGLCLGLEEARIGGSVNIVASRDIPSTIGGQVRLANLEVKTELKIENVCLGLAEDAPHETYTIDARSLSAETLTIRRVRPLAGAGIDTWLDPQLRPLSIDLSESSVGTLHIEASRFTGRFTAAPLRCAGDACINGRIGGEVDLGGAEIGGSLDISGLRMDPSARFLSLKDGAIGHALRLARPRKPGNRPPSLLRARRTQLRCLADTTLVETLWKYETDERGTLYRQSAFLERKGTYHLLDRRADVLGDFVRRYGHRLTDVEAAKEYFRLRCAYGPSERRFRWLVAAPDQLPPFAASHADQDPMTDRAHLDSARAVGAALVAPAAGSQALEALDSIDFTVECEEVHLAPSARRFDIRARLVCGDILARGRFQLFAAGRKTIELRSRSKPERAVRLAGLPVADGQHLEHPRSARSADQWVTPPALEVCKELDRQESDRLEGRLGPHLSSGFSMQGQIDLDNLSCTTLDDRAGYLWGPRAQIAMNHFVYRQAHGYPRQHVRKPSHRLLLDWLLAKLAEWLWPFRTGRMADWLRDRDDYWEPWQIRRNWIYQQFSGPPRKGARAAAPVAICRRQIDEQEYRPQPFEQAIRVARAEGREDFAVHFEMLKQRIEWRLFNRRVRWWLGFLGIGLAASWLLVSRRGEEGTLFSPIQWATIATLVATLALMIGASSIHTLLRWLMPWMPRQVRGFLTWMVFFIPAGLLWLFSDWWSFPYHFLIGFLIFVTIRWMSVFAHFVMRFGFGYLRRPVRAISTLIAAFLIGWWGVYLANARHMLVINAEPVAGLVRGHGSDGLMGSESDPSGAQFVHNVPCGPTISAPLYALDVLIPLVDLREESRCEVRRVRLESPQDEREGRTTPPQVEYLPPDPTRMGFSELLGSIPEMTVGNFRFWWGLKALYAILGWFIVSLSILTFAQANRTHAEAPTEKR